ncbi:transmembrane emp24 domain-containing protein p24delta7-like [Camellia sinensis]|uniref:transmembrane emp24 domain-containing protein p24delta7-like n=1 Tax=Camellia sinensis TaxID=4442 RepID=UPI0010360306|nr:transmembrane emp24 domain-containing protein p24delta7-like [Camellia sinensis]
MSVAKYTIVNPNDPHPFPESHKITVRVTSVESGQFSFQAAEAGDYMTCFWALDHKPQSTITIDFDWKTGVAAKDWTNVAKKGTINFVGDNELCVAHLNGVNGDVFEFVSWLLMVVLIQKIVFVFDRLG